MEMWGTKSRPPPSEEIDADDREGDAHHGDHRGGDADEDLAPGVGAAAVEPGREHDPPVVDGTVELMGEEEQQQCQAHQHDQDDPEAGAQRLAPPLGDP
jgi:hypothetical protein